MEAMEEKELLKWMFDTPAELSTLSGTPWTRDKQVKGEMNVGIGVSCTVATLWDEFLLGYSSTIV